MANYYCLLLDGDDTILDFQTAQRKALQETLAHFELPQDNETQEKFLQIEKEQWTKFNKGQVKKEHLLTDRFAVFLKDLGEKRDIVEMNRFYLTALAHHSESMPGAEEALKALSDVCTMAIISNGVEGVQIPRLRMSGLGRYMDDVFISERLGIAKPSPKFFETALRHLGLENKSSVLVVGDDLLADIKGGQSAGLDTCWINWSGAVNETGIQPTFTITSLDQLLPIVMEPEELAAIGTSKKHQNDLI